MAPDLYPHRRRALLAGLLSPVLGLAACTALPPAADTSALSAAWQQAARELGIGEAERDLLQGAPLQQLKPAQIDRFLALLHRAVPDLRARVSLLARRFLGQRYELYLLGEFPYEVVDPQPLFTLDASDCVVFVEHVYAMALGASWSEFFWLLQRIRYRDGVIGVATRNHYTEADWLPANRWLVRDLTEALQPAAAQRYGMVVDRERFLRERYRIHVPTPKQPWQDVYLPVDAALRALPALQAGDLVNIVSGRHGGAWVSHMGLVVLGPDGERRLLHSAEPAVREESFAAYVERARARTAQAEALARERAGGQAATTATALLGFKFLRLNDAPQAPPMAPQPRPTAYPRVPDKA